LLLSLLPLLLSCLLGAARAQETQPISVQLGGGPLTITLDGDLEFGTRVLSGVDQQYQALSAPQVQVVDARGTGAGWVIALESTEFTAGAASLPADLLTFSADGGTLVSLFGQPVSGAGPRETGASASLASPLRVVESSAGSGMGTYRWLPSAQRFVLKIPGTTPAGAYRATLTFSLTSGP
jgi:hypothetical protein